MLSSLGKTLKKKKKRNGDYINKVTEKEQQVKCQARLSESKFLLQLSSLLSKDWVWRDHMPARLARQATTYHFLSGPGNAELPALTRGGHSSGVMGANCWFCPPRPSMNK